MKKFSTLLLCSLMALTLIGMFSSCSSEKENYLSSLPSQSSLVFKVNITQLVNKSNIMNNPMVSGMLMQADQHIPEALKDKFNEIKNDPTAAGIDLKSPLAIAFDFGDLNTSTYFDNPSIVCVTAIKDVKKFDELMKGVVESEPSIVMSETNGIRKVDFPNDEASAAYNDSRIVMTFGKNPNAIALVNQKAEESMLANKNFAEFAANEQDCSMFMDYEWVMKAVLFAQNYTNAPAPISPKLMEYMKDMCVYGSLNFETGKVVGDMKIYPSETAKEYIDNFYIKPTDKLIGLLPENSYLGMNFALKNYSKSLDYFGEEVRQEIDKQLKNYGITEELIDNVHGDILIGVYEDLANAMIPGIVVALQCKDRTLFNKVKEMMYISEEGDMFAIPNMGYCVSYVDNVLVISTQALYNQCLASGSIRAWDKSWKDTTLGKTLSKGGIAIDFQAICKNQLLTQFANSKEAAMVLSILKQLETFTIQMESQQETSSELILVNKNKNALEQLIAIGISAAMAQ